MKRLQSILLIILLIGMFTSCHEITVKTKINEDGSFTRTIVVQSDKKESIHEVKLPYPVDDSWSQVSGYDSTNTDKPHTLTYTKYFSGIDEMDIRIDDDSNFFGSLERSINIYKKHGLFYSYVVFEETIKSINPYPDLDYREYLTDEDLMYLRSGNIEGDSVARARLDEATEKANAYLMESFTSGIAKTLKDGITRLNLPDVKPEIVDQFYDSIAVHIEEFDVENQDHYIDLLAAWADNEEILRLKEFQPPLFAESNKMMKTFEGIFSRDEYSQFVELPGLLTETNSYSPIGNTVRWKIDPMSYLVGDYRMYAESRVINYWGFALTGFLVLLLLIFLMIKAYR